MSTNGIGRVMISGVGFMADAYDLFVINVVVDMMKQNTYHEYPSNLLQSTVKSTALIGAIIGQIFFGSIADMIGRRKVFIITCALVIIGALLSACVQNTTSIGIYSQLALWRFILGIGVGGEYPLSAAVTSESTYDNESKIRNLALVFSMQGFGTLLCALILVLTSHTCQTNYDLMWRICLGVGGLPMIIAFYFRWKMHESKSWEKQQHINIQQSNNTNDKDNNSNIVTQISYYNTLSSIYQSITNGISYTFNTIYINRISLLGTAGTWFILDVIFYANGLFSGQITNIMGLGSSIKAESISQLILQSLSLPGYICTILFINMMGVSCLQRIGFICTAIFFFGLAIFQSYLIQVPGAYIVLYGLTFFFQNFGANATTYIIPSLIYAPAYKGTCHGLSAASGKLGAILGAQTLLYITNAYCPSYNCDQATTAQINDGLRLTFGVCGILSLFGLLWSEIFLSQVKVYEDPVSLYPTLINPNSSTDTHDKNTDNTTNHHQLYTVINPLDDYYEERESTEKIVILDSSMMNNTIHVHMNNVMISSSSNECAEIIRVNQGHNDSTTPNTGGILYSIKQTLLGQKNIEYSLLPMVQQHYSSSAITYEDTNPGIIHINASKIVSDDKTNKVI